MTFYEQQLIKAYQRSGLAFLGVSFQKAMQDKGMRIALSCVIKANKKGKQAPVQLALI